MKIITISDLINEIKKAEIENENSSLEYALTKNARVSLRMRLLAYCFAHKCNAQEANAQLQKHACETLYPRNLYDATILYAFEKHYSFEQWKNLYQRAQKEQSKLAKEAKKQCVKNGKESLANNTNPTVLELDRNSTKKNPIFITIENLTEYLEFFKNDAVNNGLNTNAYTEFMMNRLDALIQQEPEDQETAFLNFLRDNFEKFSECRQRARRIFIEIFRDYLNYWKTEYEKNPPVDLSDYVFYNDTKLANDTTNDIPTCRANLHNVLSALDCYYGNLFLMNKKSYQQDNAHIDFFDDEVDYTPKLYHVFEEFLRNIFQGKVDVTRSFFILFTLFSFQTTEQKITISRLNQLLAKCGFMPLDCDSTSNDVDFYVCQFLTDTGISAQDFDLLSEMIDECYTNKQEFFFYHSKTTAGTLQKKSATYAQKV